MQKYKDLVEVPNNLKIDGNGSLNISATGTGCTIVDGVASGFSTTSRLNLSGKKIIPANELKSFESSTSL